mmetsp:Transcript_10020/g.24775  ORF Transcript_10020/g.24775 Transcript_10020/m.24775 type:complete len:435 (-) Transcript_10020:625-1929(-)
MRAQIARRHARRQRGLWQGGHVDMVPDIEVRVRGRAKGCGKQQQQPCKARHLSMHRHRELQVLVEAVQRQQQLLQLRTPILRSVRPVARARAGLGGGELRLRARRRHVPREEGGHPPRLDQVLVVWALQQQRPRVRPRSKQAHLPVLLHACVEGGDKASVPDEALQHVGEGPPLVPRGIGLELLEEGPPDAQERPEPQVVAHLSKRPPRQQGPHPAHLHAHRPPPTPHHVDPRADRVVEADGRAHAPRDGHGDLAQGVLPHVDLQLARGREDRRAREAFLRRQVHQRGRGERGDGGRAPREPRGRDVEEVHAPRDEHQAHAPPPVGREEEGLGGLLRELRRGPHGLQQHVALGVVPLGPRHGPEPHAPARAPPVRRRVHIRRRVPLLPIRPRRSRIGGGQRGQLVRHRRGVDVHVPQRVAPRGAVVGEDEGLGT